MDCLERSLKRLICDDDDAAAIIVLVRPRHVAAWGDAAQVCVVDEPSSALGDGRRRWRALMWARRKCSSKRTAPRVKCHDPWRNGRGGAMGASRARRTRADFDDLGHVASGPHGQKVQSWNSSRRMADGRVDRHPCEHGYDATVDHLDGLRQIGIDGVTYKRGHRYLIVVVDRGRGRLVRAGPAATTRPWNVFFDELGPERAALLTHVSADMADWIARVVAARAPNAVRSADPFHVVAWAIDALDIERRRAWNQAKGRHSTRGLGLAREGHSTGDTNASPNRVTRCGRTPAISPAVDVTSSTGSPRPTRDCGAPTFSKKDCVTRSR